MIGRSILILNGEYKTKKITVYEKPTCTTCRSLSKILNENGIDFEKVNYYIKPFSKSKLQSLLKKMKMKPAEILRTKEKIYKQLDLKNKIYSDEDLIDLMIKYPDLVQRPIVETGERAVLARPPEKVKVLI
jgi:arsenate reductase